MAAAQEKAFCITCLWAHVQQIQKEMWIVSFIDSIVRTRHSVSYFTRDVGSLKIKSVSKGEDPCNL